MVMNCVWVVDLYVRVYGEVGRDYHLYIILD